MAAPHAKPRLIRSRQFSLQIDLRNKWTTFCKRDSFRTQIALLNFEYNSLCFFWTYFQSKMSFSLKKVVKCSTCFVCKEKATCLLLTRQKRLPFKWQLWPTMCEEQELRMREIYARQEMQNFSIHSLAAQCVCVISDIWMSCCKLMNIFHLRIEFKIGCIF